MTILYYPQTMQSLLQADYALLSELHDYASGLACDCGQSCTGGCFSARIKQQLASHEQLEQTHLIDLFWSIEDIYRFAEDNELALTPEEAEAAAVWIEDNHDASIGINWTVIDEAINHVKGEGI